LLILSQSAGNGQRKREGTGTRNDKEAAVLERFGCLAEAKFLTKKKKERRCHSSFFQALTTFFFPSLDDLLFSKP
jgi:hypothetical protein